MPWPSTPLITDGHPTDASKHNNVRLAIEERQPVVGFKLFQPAYISSPTSETMVDVQPISSPPATVIDGTVQDLRDGFEELINKGSTATGLAGDFKGYTLADPPGTDFLKTVFNEIAGGQVDWTKSLVTQPCHPSHLNDFQTMLNEMVVFRAWPAVNAHFTFAGDPNDQDEAQSTNANSDTARAAALGALTFAGTYTGAIQPNETLIGRYASRTGAGPYTWKAMCSSELEYVFWTGWLNTGGVPPAALTVSISDAWFLWYYNVSSEPITNDIDFRMRVNGTYYGGTKNTASPDFTWGDWQVFYCNPLVADILDNGSNTSCKIRYGNVDGDIANDIAGAGTVVSDGIYTHDTDKTFGLLLLELDFVYD